MVARNEDPSVRFVLDLLRRAAEHGERCPTRPEIREALEEAGLPTPIYACPAELAYAGLIRIEVYGKNYRVVQIDDLRTAEAPAGWLPYLIIEDGRRQNLEHHAYP